MMKTYLKQWVWLGISLIFAFWLTRVLAITVFPPFIDESVHVYFGEINRHTSPLTFANEGRLFTIWWYMIFQPHLMATFWVVRVATVLMAMMSMAAIISLGHLVAPIWGGVLAGLIYLFSTYHMFFERLALADSLSAAAISVALYFAYRLKLRAHLKDALLTGAVIFVAVGFKVSALPYLGIPVAAVLTLRSKNGGWKGQVRWLAVALATALGLIGIYALGLRVFGYDPFYLIGMHNPNVGNTLLKRVFDNASNTLGAFSIYTGPVVSVLLWLSVAVLIIRRRFYLPLCLLAPMFIVWINQRQTIRFYTVPMTILLLCGAIVLADDIVRQRRLVGYSLLLLFLWGVLQWLPFVWIASHNPLELNLPAADYNEYILSDASGSGLADVHTYLRDLQPNKVFGLLSNCQSLRYMSQGVFPVICPRVNPNGSDVESLAALMAENRAEGVYVVLEDSPYVPSQAPGQLLAMVNRPGNGPSLSIYDLALDH